MRLPSMTCGSQARTLHRPAELHSVSATRPFADRAVPSVASHWPARSRLGTTAMWTVRPFPTLTVQYDGGLRAWRLRSV